MDSFPFPNNFEAYFQKAMNEMVNGNLEQTVTYIQKALTIQMDEELFNVCLTLLKDLNRLEESLELIKQHKAYLYESIRVEKNDLIFITLLIESGRLSEAKKQINQRWANLKNNPDYAHIQNILEQYLNQVETKQLQQKEEGIDKVLTESKSIINKPYYLQMNFVKSIQVLSDQDILIATNELLRNQSVHPLIKTEVLSLLVDRGMTGSIELYKEGVKQSVKLAQLKQPNESSFYLEGIYYIENQIFKDEMEKQRLQENFFLHVLYYYPFETEIFGNPDAWFTAVRFPVKNSRVSDYVERAEKGLDLLT
ncbi:hypothetical protein [Jeotgalibaca sp. A127]|uniref:hypothetical protein n=1 Tax=Jeotgalibaca sp. A127 TaxID=3457324 RepID=UPI003FCF7A26